MAEAYEPLLEKKNPRKNNKVGEPEAQRLPQHNQDQLEKKKVKSFNSKVNSVTLSSNENFIVIGLEELEVKIWDLKEDEKQEERIIYKHKMAVASVAISQDEKYIVSGSWNKSIIIWNLENGKEECVFNHEDRVNSVALNHDGNLIASGSNDSTVGI